MKVTVEVEVTPPGEIDEAARTAASLIGVEMLDSEYARGIVEFIADSYGWVVGNSWLDEDRKREAIRTLIKGYANEESSSTHSKEKS